MNSRISPTKKLSPQTPPTVVSEPGAEIATVHELHPCKHAPLVKRIVHGSQNLVDGTFRVGPKHTWHAVKEKPVQYGLLLASVGGLGAGFMAAGIDPEPYTVGLSALVCGWSACKAVPEIRATKGPDRMRLIGAHVVWPAAIASVTTLAGLSFGHGSEHATLSAADIAKSGAQSAVIGSDVPTIVQTVLDTPKTEREKRGFLKWLLRHW